MSQLLAPAHTLADRIPLWRRIREIMKEKGSSYSLNAVANRLGISRETLRLMLNGEREIFLFELEKIAQDLHVPVERILQSEPWAQEFQEKFHQLLSASIWSEALVMVQERSQFSLGLSEKAHDLRLTAMILIWKGEYAETLPYYLEMHSLAAEIYEKYKDEHLLSIALKNLASIYLEVKEYQLALELIQGSEHLYYGSPREMARLYDFYARIKLASHDWAEAAMYFHKCLEQRMQDDDVDRLSKAHHNVAHIEFIQMNYMTAKEHLVTAKKLAKSKLGRILAAKDLAKVLIKLKEHVAAEELIWATLREEGIQDYPDLEGRLHILLSRATNKPRYAERVSTNLHFPKQVRFMAIRFLARYYKKRLYQRNRSGWTCRQVSSKRRFPLDQNL